MYYEDPSHNHSADPPLVLLVEDERSIADPFSHALQRAGFRTSVASTAAEALALAGASRPDVILLDLGLPDGDGRDVCRRIRRDSQVPIIMVTASGTVTDRVVGLELGADDYVVKPFSTGEVIARIRAVLRRGHGRPLEGAELNVQDLVIDPGARRAWRAGQELELTRKEFDLLARLARDAGRVVLTRDPDVRRLGHELVRLDQDPGRAHRLVEAQAR